MFGRCWSIPRIIQKKSMVFCSFILHSTATLFHQHPVFEPHSAYSACSVSQQTPLSVHPICTSTSISPHSSRFFQPAGKSETGDLVRRSKDSLQLCNLSISRDSRNAELGTSLDLGCLYRSLTRSNARFGIAISNNFDLPGKYFSAVIHSDRG